MTSEGEVKRSPQLIPQAERVCTAAPMGPSHPALFSPSLCCGLAAVPYQMPS